MYFGNAWYPEHWPEERWPEDVRLMRDLGMNVCRIAEFAWSTMEPIEGHYRLDWLERAVDLLHRNGIAVVLGTPTAAPPAWLTHRYPETLTILPNGRPMQHGNRCHGSPNSPVFVKYSRLIVEQMARRFGKDERVIGWQIDNEYGHADYSEEARRQFHAFLKERYGSLEALNEAWATAYWSQSYDNWEEIPLPIGPHNPGLMLDFRRFVTHTWRRFQKVQVDTIRAYARPEQWITSNYMGWYEDFDHYLLAEDLDMVSWDWYIGTGHHDYLTTGALHDLTRGLKRRNFWVMETQPGSVNWASVNNVLYRGEARVMAFHAVAHGADALLYWQWRAAPGGQEQLHGCLIGADGKPRPFYEEAKEIGADFAKVSDVLRNTEVRNEVAILHSYDARWAVNFQRHHRDFDPVNYLYQWYRPLASRQIGADVLRPEAELAGYRVVIAPALMVLSEEVVQNLVTYVARGGLLVLTPRCGQRDIHNRLYPYLQPGPLREIAGVEVEEYYALDEEVPVKVALGDVLEGQGRIWAERLRPLSDRTEILGHYGVSNGWLDGRPALTWHPHESGGGVLYVGAWLEETLQKALTDWLVSRAHLQTSYHDVPEGVEVAKRVTPDNSRTLYFVINHTRRSHTLPMRTPLRPPLTDLISGVRFDESIHLEPYAVHLFEVR
ncbi:beta-galactosidase [Chthonomonas calidirosea]|uniref:beta-galactosidase n=1 Tax=Chthonomonas calidirosea TaxID=454171 RepID=UPI0006DD458C|nr:beta-galactosidase [Chthonomonas calidirosea]CEK17222.1 beta-galactosidase [Chthonomonas calidirosea]